MSASAAFFRSMSLEEDLAHPERFSHYRPTRRALPIVDAVVRAGAATMVIAPYGSGKSLAAGVGALCVRNDRSDRAIIEPILAKIAYVDASLAARLASRLRGNRRGKVVVLSGLVSEPLSAIASSLGMAHAPKTVDGLRKAIREGGWDHVAVVWDEFGRHLEGLVADGRSSELDIVQRLAERSARADAQTMSCTLLLHQNLLSYATRLNETSRTEWRKIEGRFSALRLVEDSQEFFELVSDVVQDLRGTPAPRGAGSRTSADAVVRAGWFDKMESVERVSRILAKAQPLTPGALQVLPTIVARVGQNERSLFSFLREQDLSRRVGIEEVYIGFSDAMRTDVGIGGTYRRWVETESARSRAGTALKREMLAAACLLQLGGSGERRRVPRAVVELAVATSSKETRAERAAFDELVSARLLLWRQHNDDVAVWHGADIDVALRVREERERRVGLFDVRQFLTERFPAPHLRAPGHNAQFGVNRFFEGRYVTASDLQSGPPEPSDTCGVVAYLLATDRTALDAGRRAVGACADQRLIIVIPDKPLDIESAALELVAIEALRADRSFLASDPLIATELDELHSVAFEQLARLMRGLLDPTGSTASWYSQGVRLEVSPERPASVSASRLLNEWYHRTPRIANEQLMRVMASRTMQTARVRVVSSILERSDRPRLGYVDGDRSAEGSIYRTVIERTGLRPVGGTSFADPDEIPDEGLMEVWGRIQAFFIRPTDDPSRPRPLARLVEELAAPPMGVPRAVMPILIASGFKHFARAVALYRDGEYLPDILGFPFDAMVTSPGDFTLRVLEPTAELTEYLSEVCYAFTHERPGPADELVRRAHDALAGWLLTVPDGSRRSNRLSANARSLLRCVDASRDPIDLLTRALPHAFGCRVFGPSLVAQVERARTEIDRLRDQYADEAVAVIQSSFARYQENADAVDALKSWAACFDIDELDRNAALRIVDRSVVRKALETANGRFSEKSLANALSSILLQRNLDKWDDRTAAQFSTALREARERVEAAALDTEHPVGALRPIIEAKMSELHKMLAKIDNAAGNRAGGVRAAGGAR